jgi:hypothetical protein
MGYNMKEWYCIIKAADEFGWYTLIKDKIFAETKKEARKKIESEYKIKMPMRLPTKEITPSSLLLSLYEMDDKGNYSFINKMFESNNCLQCNISFKMVDSYNLTGRSYGAFCSDDCKYKHYLENRKFDLNDWDSSLPVIYKITQISTGKIYIGQTIRSFTLRWWEHIKSLDDIKFHNALRNSDITDWIFQVIETLDSKDNLNEKERFWINNYDSISKGFNSI